MPTPAAIRNAFAMGQSGWGHYAPNSDDFGVVGACGSSGCGCRSGVGPVGPLPRPSGSPARWDLGRQRREATGPVGAAQGPAHLAAVRRGHGRSCRWCAHRGPGMDGRRAGHGWHPGGFHHGPGSQLRVRRQARDGTKPTGTPGARSAGAGPTGSPSLVAATCPRGPSRRRGTRGGQGVPAGCRDDGG